MQIYPQYGFTGNVALAVSGLPSGVTGTFAPNPANVAPGQYQGTSTLTLTASSTAALGQYTIKITGTSGSQTASTTLTLGVYKPTFTLSSSTIVSIGQGTSTTQYVSVFPEYGFTGNVNLAISGLPSGVTASFSPNPVNVASGDYEDSSTLTLTASSTAALGQYTVTVTGTSGAQTATSTFSLGVYQPTFTLSSGYSAAAGQGQTVTSYVYVNGQYGFSGNVNLSVSGLPSGVTASFSPNPTTYYSTLTLAVSSSAPVGTSTLTITGTSGSVTATTTFLLTIAAPSFTIFSTTSSLSLNEGASGNAYIYLNSQNGFNSAVTYTATGLPSGVTATFSPNPSNQYSTTLTLAASSSASPGLSTVTITGTSGTLTGTTSLTLTINTPGFQLSAAPLELTLMPGGSARSTIGIVPQNGFSGSVSLAAAGLPTGVTAAFSPNPTTGTSTLTLTASSSAAVGTSTVTVTGTSGSITGSTTIPLSVVAPETGTTTALTLTAGGSAVSSVSAGTAVTATATVSAGSTAVTTGQVNFCAATATYCDSIHLLGSAQLTSAGTAVLHFIPGAGSHSYKAVFVGTSVNAASTSSAASLTVTAAIATKTTIAQSGTEGNYTLTATVSGNGPIGPTGNVSFLDTSNNNASVGTATLGSATSVQGLSVTESDLVGNSPNSIAKADFNGDGIPDLAVANSGRRP